MSKRDYGQTTSSLLQNMEFKWRKRNEALKDELFLVRGQLWQLEQKLKRALARSEGSDSHDQAESDPI